MDRNPVAVGSLITLGGSLSARRAWIEIHFMPNIGTLRRSLSARRAWIEIVRFTASLILPLSLSARRAWIEIKYVVKDSDFTGSLSARRAWIEICCPCRSQWLLAVALRKESVDRNSEINTRGSKKMGRSPQGERG